MTAKGSIQKSFRAKMSSQAFVSRNLLSAVQKSQPSWALTSPSTQKPHEPGFCPPVFCSDKIHLTAKTRARHNMDPGLTASYAIVVQEHSGKIHLESQTGANTEVTTIPKD